MKNNIPFDIVCFGEVLWDILPTGATPGGAPMNVAYHLTRQQCHPTIITRIGEDQAGTELQEIFSTKGVDTTYFQLDAEHETGKVYGIADEHKDMTYDIVKPVAWDFISWDPGYGELLSQASYFVFGSLAARSQVSKDTLFSLLEIAPKKAFDINLRSPHFSKELITALLPKIDLLKVNLEELQLVAQWLSPFTSVEDNIQFLADKYDINQLVVTKGGSGALLFVDGFFYNHEGYQVKVADTVGSGDAFLAGLLSSLQNNVQPAEALERASRLGAFIATKHGACPEYDSEWLTTDDWLISNVK